jgi:sugar lactone lactonase YvrE
MDRRFIKIILFILVVLFSALACGLFDGDTEEPTGTASTTEPTLAPTLPPPTDKPIPTATPEPEVELGEELVSTDGGFSLLLVPGYQSESMFGIVSMEAPDADADRGPAIMILGGPNEEGMSLEEMRIDFTEDMESESSIRVTKPQDILIDGALGVMMDIEGDDEGVRVAGRIVIVLVNENQQFIMFGFAPDNRWEEELLAAYMAVLDTVKFFEPEFTLDFDPGGQDSLEEYRQWAVDAAASSAYSTTNWSALQATGAPDTFECGDIETAWASAEGSGVDWLELYYDVPVLPTEVNIYETHSPGQITTVYVIDEAGALFEIYSAVPELGECPRVLTIEALVDTPVVGVRIELDQSVIPATWNEIDAVELVGLVESALVEVPIEEAVEDPADTGDAPDGFLWRVGGESGVSDGEFAVLGGMDTDWNDLLYVSDNIHGIWVYDAAGTLVRQIDLNEFNNAHDVKVGSSGNIYVASWGNNTVFVLDADGNILTTFGGEGNGPGEFGTFSPSAIAVDANENIYVLDENKDDSDEDFTRIQVFDTNGVYLYEFPVDDDFFAANAMEFGPNGNLYVLGFIGGYLQEYTADGTYVGEVGETALDFTGPQHLDIDADGNFYISVWSPDGVVKLDPAGNFVASWGFPVDDGEQPWPEGGFYSIKGVGVLKDGSVVFAGDWSGDYSYLTVFEFP